ncbi:solute carrier family 22 member 23 [Platysternon megacephalum]|uniref:Solute carrier family 22 member 23 n=1 Tax=Platysternon megacephalum TaxID=55544 RepID=A0A4D9EHZ7_9SAUR|nr:solute carrier family 22 member 23 [Platysternon megacephalum]
MEPQPGCRGTKHDSQQRLALVQRFPPQAFQTLGKSGPLLRLHRAGGSSPQLPRGDGPGPRNESVAKPGADPGAVSAATRLEGSQGAEPPQARWEAPVGQAEACEEHMGRDPGRESRPALTKPRPATDAGSLALLTPRNRRTPIAADL